MRKKQLNTMFLIYGVLCTIIFIEAFALLMSPEPSLNTAQLIVPPQRLANAQVFADPALGFAVQYPKNWGQPTKVKENARTTVRFAEPLSVSVASFQDEKSSRHIPTPEEIVKENFPSDAIVEETVFSGRNALKVSYMERDAASSALVPAYAILIPKRQSEYVIIYVKNPSDMSQLAIVNHVIGTVALLKV